MAGAETAKTDTTAAKTDTTKTPADSARVVLPGIESLKAAFDSLEASLSGASPDTAKMGAALREFAKQLKGNSKFTSEMDSLATQAGVSTQEALKSVPQERIKEAIRNGSDEFSLEGVPQSQLDKAAADFGAIGQRIADAFGGESTQERRARLRENPEPEPTRPGQNQVLEEMGYDKDASLDHVSEKKVARWRRDLDREVAPGTTKDLTDHQMKFLAERFQGLRFDNPVQYMREIQSLRKPPE